MNIIYNCKLEQMFLKLIKPKKNIDMCLIFIVLYLKKLCFFFKT